MKAFIYARTSSDDGEKTSITNQIEECKKYAQKNGWEVVGTFFDKDISGYSYWDSPEGHQLSLLDESIKEHYKNKEIVYRKGLADLISKNFKEKKKPKKKIQRTKKKLISLEC